MLHFGREPSNSTGGTPTHVATNFTGAHLKTAFEMVEIAKMLDAKWFAPTLAVSGVILSRRCNPFGANQIERDWLFQMPF